MSAGTAHWRSLTRKNIKTLALVAAGIATLYVGAVRPQVKTALERSRGFGVANSRGGSSNWRNTRVFHQLGVSHDRPLAKGVAGGVPGGIASSKAIPVCSMAYASLAAGDQDKADGPSDDRIVVRTSTIELVVLKPAEAANKIRVLAEREGGFLVSSEVRGDQDVSGGTVTIRVPAARFENMWAEIRELGLRVETERLDAQDVTRQYVDQDANLGNLRAQEAQYLSILKQAKTVKDTLEVSEKLSEVRGQIEQQQAEFDALLKQIETVAFTVSLRAEAEARVFGLSWRPLYHVKTALRDGLDGLANYASTMTAVVFFLPTVMLWLATIVIGGAVGWRLVRWIARRWFGWNRAAAPAQV